MKLIRLKMYAKLEDYEVYDEKRLKGMTDNLRRMALEDERKKAKRNTGKIVSELGSIRAKEGREEGKKSGKSSGTWVGGIGGALLGAALGKGRNLTGAGAIGGAALGALGGRWLGGKIGAANGEADGRARGLAEGRRMAKEGGHDEIDVATRHARTFDDYARKHKLSDNWETGLRDQLKGEAKEREEKAAKARAEALERRRVEAEESRAHADEMRARTDRSRYYDEHFGTGQYGRQNGGYNNRY